MNISLMEPAPEQPTYPYVGIDSDGFMILFSNPREGISLNDNHNYEQGENRVDWPEGQFVPVERDIIISN